MMNTNFNSVAVGDVVLISGGRIPDRIGPVTKVTPKQFQAGDNTFWKKDGSRLGNANSWTFTYASVATKADVTRIKRERRRRDNDSAFAGCRTIDLSDGDLETIANIIRDTYK